MTATEIRLRVGEREIVYCAEPGAGMGRQVILSCPEGRFELRVTEDGRETEPLPEELCGVGKVLWDRGIRENPIPLYCGIRPGLLLCSTREDRVVAVTAEVGRAELSPRRIPLRFETPLVDDLVTVPDARFRITALRMGDPYGVIFPETVGDCRLFDRWEEISRLHIFPQGAEILFAYLKEETELHLRAFHRDGGRELRGTDLCAALAAAVATGRCMPNRAVRIPLAEGEARAVCTREGVLFLTCPVFPGSA